MLVEGVCCCALQPMMSLLWVGRSLSPVTAAPKTRRQPIRSSSSDLPTSIIAPPQAHRMMMTLLIPVPPSTTMRDQGQRSQVWTKKLPSLSALFETAIANQYPAARTSSSAANHLLLLRRLSYLSIIPLLMWRCKILRHCKILLRVTASAPARQQGPAQA